MTDQTNNVNLNATECLRSVQDIGSTTVRNICSGAEHVVPWGSLDWLAFAGIGTMIGGMAAIIVGFACVAVYEWTRRL